MTENLPQTMTLRRGTRDGAPFLEVEIDGTVYSSLNDDDARRCMSKRAFETLRMASRRLTGTTGESSAGIPTISDGVFTDGEHDPGVCYITPTFGSHRASLEFEPIFFQTEPQDAITAKLADRITAIRAWAAFVRVRDREEAFAVPLPAA